MCTNAENGKLKTEILIHAKIVSQRIKIDFNSNEILARGTTAKVTEIDRTGYCGYWRRTGPFESMMVFNLFSSTNH